MPEATRPSKRPSRPPRGFTIIEAVVALLLLSIGALGLASTSAWSARLGVDARAIERQSRNVQDVADSLRIVSCTALSAGSRSIAGGSVSWSVAHIADVVQATILAPPPSRRSTPLQVEIIIPCE